MSPFGNVPKGGKMKKAITIVLVLIMLFGISTTYATEEEAVPETVDVALVEKQETVITVKAKVTSVGEVYDKEVGSVIDRIQDVKLEILDGEHKGKKFDATYILSYDIDNKIMSYELDKGNTVLAQLSLEDGEVKDVIVQDVVRQSYIIWMIIIFFGFILIIGRKQGLKAIIGLVITILAVYFIMITNIFKGHSPVWVSIGTSTLIIIVTFIIIGGLNKKTITAMLGTTGGVVCAGIVSIIFGHLAKLSGGQEDAIMLSMSAGNIAFNFRELLFAGIVIAALGACMDVGMSIASALDEIKQKNQEITWKELLKSGMNIGGDIMGTMTNTLILAYVGGALTLILLFMASNMNIVDIINKETIAADAISALAASMGVLFTIPITTVCYALLNRDKTIYKKKPDIAIEGQRSLKI